MHDTFVVTGAQAMGWTYRHIGEYGGNPQRLYLMGHSAGAYNNMVLRNPAVDKLIDGVVQANSRSEMFLTKPGGITKTRWGSSQPRDALKLTLGKSKAQCIFFLAALSWWGRAPFIVGELDMGSWARPRHRRSDRR